MHHNIAFAGGEDEEGLLTNMTNSFVTVTCHASSQDEVSSLLVDHMFYVHVVDGEVCVDELAQHYLCNEDKSPVHLFSAP